MLAVYLQLKLVLYWTMSKHGFKNENKNCGCMGQKYQSGLWKYIMTAMQKKTIASNEKLL